MLHRKGFIKTFQFARSKRNTRIESKCVSIWHTNLLLVWTADLYNIKLLTVPCGVINHFSHQLPRCRELRHFVFGHTQISANKRETVRKRPGESRNSFQCLKPKGCWEIKCTAWTYHLQPQLSFIQSFAPHCDREGVFLLLSGVKSLPSRERRLSVAMQQKWKSVWCVTLWLKPRCFWVSLWEEKTVGSSEDFNLQPHRLNVTSDLLWRQDPPTREKQDKDMSFLDGRTEKPESTPNIPSLGLQGAGSL